MAFGGIKNRYVRIVHGIGQYHAGFTEECDYDEAVVAFMGDRVESRTPTVVKIISQALGMVSQEGYNYVRGNITHFLFSRRK